MTASPGAIAAQESADRGPWTWRSTLWLVLCIGPLVSCIAFLGWAWHDVHVLAKQNPGTAYQQVSNFGCYLGLTASGAFMAFVHILYFSLRKFRDECTGKRPASLLKVCLFIWILGPPLFFIFEWGKLYLGPFDGPVYEMYKTGQDLATKLWGAILVILIGLYKDWSL